MTTPSQAAQAQAEAPQSVNGTAPAAEPAEECETCVTKAELALAIVVGSIAAVLLAMAIDTGTGGKLSGLIGLGRGEIPADDGTDAGA